VKLQEQTFSCRTSMAINGNLPDTPS
jgi:hypothetical protein